MPLDTNKLTEDVMRAEDARDLLDHIAWTDTIEPRLLAEKQRCQDLLTSAVLGVPVSIMLANGSTSVVTAEQLAGRIEGITFILALLRDVLKRGDRALKILSTLN